MSSPKDKKQTVSAQEENQNIESRAQQTNQSTAAQADQTSKVEAGTESSSTSQPLAPPPKPSQQDGDYFSGSHNNSHFLEEPNPFEQSFGNPGQETPGKSFGGLPSVASLTSPAPLGPGGTPGWQNSLRSGPLSPAMLTGPTNTSGDYFDSSFRQSFPTPNESSLRSGLTPGGGGSMFPAPSPNSQALFNSIQSGGATPGTLDFHRTAMNAAARSKSDQNTSMSSMQGINKQDYQPAQQQQQPGTAANPFNNNSEHDAVNSLYMLANNGRGNANQFAMSNQGMNNNVAQMSQRMSGQQDASPTTQREQKHSIGGMSGSTGMSENGDYGSDDADQKGSAKKGKKGGKAANGRRKAEDSAGKGSNKKAKNNSIDEDMDLSDDGASIKDENDNQGSGQGNKKLTDEEKRKNFLERNRVAALKCRQRKKQWLANLQAKVEIFTSENEALTTQCGQLRDEITGLKTLLMAHKDCPVSHQQGIGGASMAQVLGADFDHPNANPYGMPAMGPGQGPGVGPGGGSGMMMGHQPGMQRS